MPSRPARKTRNRPGAGELALAVVTTYPRQSVVTLMGLSAAATICINALFLQPGRHPAPLFARTQVIDVQTPAERPRVIETSRQAPALAAPVMSPPAAPAPQPAAVRDRADIITDLQRELARKGFYDGAVDGVWGSRTDQGLRNFLQAAGVKGQPDATEEMVRLVAKSNVAVNPNHARRGDPIGDLLSRAPPAATPVPPAVIPAAVPAQMSGTATPGSKRLAAVQKTLADFGYGQVKPTGTLGPETQAAIERFERERKLPVTGQLSDRMLRELGIVSGRSFD